MLRTRFPKLLSESVPATIVASEQLQEDQTPKHRDKGNNSARLALLHISQTRSVVAEFIATLILGCRAATKRAERVTLCQATLR